MKWARSLQEIYTELEVDRGRDSWRGSLERIEHSDGIANGEGIDLQSRSRSQGDVENPALGIDQESEQATGFTGSIREQEISLLQSGEVFAHLLAHFEHQPSISVMVG